MSTEAQVTTAAAAFQALDAWQTDPTELNRQAFGDAAARFMVEYRNEPRTAIIEAEALGTMAGIAQAYEFARMSGAQVVELAKLLPGEPLVHIRDMVAMVTDTISAELGVTRDELRALIVSPDPHDLPDSLQPPSP